jgi:hypothetical protein
LRVNVTNTASGSSSLLADFQVNGTSVLEVNSRGLTKVRKVSNITEYVNIFEVFKASSSFFQIRDDGNYTFPSVKGGALATYKTVAKSGGFFLASGGQLGWTSSATDGYNIATDLSIVRDAANTLAQRSTTNPQTFRLYNTYTDASNYERGFLRWSSNVLQIGTEKAGTGSARSVEFHYDGTAAFRVFPQGINVRAAGMLGFASNGITGVDVALDRPSASVIRIGDNSTNNPPALRIHNQLGSTEYAALRWASNEFIFDANAGSGTLRGIKLGSASTSLLGFFGATPVVQQAAVADATDAATAITQLNDLLAAMRTLGLIAT